MATRMTIQRERLRMYLDAERAVLQGQSYTIGKHTLTRANLSEIREMIDSLLDDGVTLDESDDSGTTRRVKQVVFRD